MNATIEINLTMTEPRTYTATVSHPTNYHSGKHTFTVYDAIGYAKGLVHVSSPSFGSSRNYLADDKTAIARLLSEHACTIIGKARKARKTKIK